MIVAEFYRDPKGFVFRYQLSGHAEYADPGEDIICAAVSALAINTANSLEALTDSHASAEDQEGLLICKIPNYTGADVQLLIRSLRMGLQMVQEAYGKTYLQIREHSASQN